MAPTAAERFLGIPLATVVIKKTRVPVTFGETKLGTFMGQAFNIASFTKFGIDGVIFVAGEGVCAYTQ